MAKEDRQPGKLLHADLGQEFDRGGSIIQCSARAQDHEEQANRVA